MNLFDWLSTPQGIEAEHAILVFLNILGVWLAHRSNTHTHRVEKRLDMYTRSLMRQIHGGHDHE